MSAENHPTRKLLTTQGRSDAGVCGERSGAERQRRVSDRSADLCWSIRGDGLAPIPDARKGGVWLANSTPIADLRRDEYITAMCRKPTMSELSFVRAVIAECRAWELTIGIRRGGFRRWPRSRRQTRRGRSPSWRQSLGIAPLRAASGIRSPPAGLRSSTRGTAE